MLLLLLSEFHEEITERWLVGLDQATMAVVHSWMTPRLTQVMFGFTRIGSWQFMLPFVTLLLLFLLLKRHGREAAILAIAVGGSAVLNIGLKLWFHRARPEVPWALAHEQSFSFPSGQAVAALCFYATGTFLLARGRRGTTRTILIVIVGLVILGIGISRVYLGVHYPSEIVAGYLVGMVWVSAVLMAGYYLKRMNKP